MATSINAGFKNNVNTIHLRVNGAHGHTMTDRAIDIDGDGEVEKSTVTYVSGHAVGTPSAPGGIIKNTYNTPAGAARTVIDEVTEPDGGVSLDRDVNEYTEGVD